MDVAEETYYEWGYRLGPTADCREVWAVDHGDDGCWTPAIPDLKMPAVDIYPGAEESAIRRVIDDRRLVATVIRRRVIVTRGDIEDVAAVGVDG